MLENAKRRAAFARQGVPDDKIALTGLLSHDMLAAAMAARTERRRQLVERFGFDAAAPLCLLAIPSYPEQGLIDWPQHRAALIAVLTTLDRLGVRTLLSSTPNRGGKTMVLLNNLEIADSHLTSGYLT